MDNIDRLHQSVARIREVLGYNYALAGVSFTPSTDEDTNPSPITMANSDDTRLYFNETFIDSLDDATLDYVMAHMYFLRDLKVHTPALREGRNWRVLNLAGTYIASAMVANKNVGTPITGALYRSSDDANKTLVEVYDEILPLLDEDGVMTLSTFDGEFTLPLDIIPDDMEVPA